MSSDGDPDHPVLDKPFCWELLEFVYRSAKHWQDSYIDMTFGRDGVVKRLRFYAPRELEMSRGLPTTSGMYILDVSRRGLEGIGVRVATFEDSSGAPQFWAASVVDLDQLD